MNMRLTLAFLVALSASTLTSCADVGLQPFEFPTDMTRSACNFAEVNIPSNVIVYAAAAAAEGQGRRLGFEIDKSGNEAMQMDVAVNSPDRPVVLILGASGPTIWHVGWSPGTRILAVVVTGNHRQGLAGLEKTTPQLNSTSENGAPCGFFSPGSERDHPLAPMPKRIFGQAVDKVFKARDGKVVIGDPLPSGARLVTSSDIPVSTFAQGATLAGPTALEAALQNGVLRRATAADAKAWADATAGLTPAAGRRVPTLSWPPIHAAYVVLKPFAYPNGLTGSDSVIFLVSKGTEVSRGRQRHLTTFDFNTLECDGTWCGDR